MTELIRLEGIKKQYLLGRSEVTALRDVSIEFGRGEFTAIAGPSGSGKTTLLNIIGCIDKPDSGRVIIEGHDVTATPLAALASLRRRRLGFIFQGFNLIEVLTAHENIEYPLWLAGWPAERRRERVNELLMRVRIESHRGHRPRELSGGQRQRVAIARALAGGPIAVLADEPTANLDSQTSEEVLSLMQELNLEQGTTFIFSTHDPRIIGKANRVVWLKDGAIDESLDISPMRRPAPADCVTA
ncbi:MAG: ABC transporter ATP-binding protein [Acidobacteriota bacterium]